jgi:hypothetical protein
VQAQLVIYHEPKDGYTLGEWEDGAFGGVGSVDPAGGRFVVVDGATEAYDVRRWVDQLVGSFMSPDLPDGAGYPDLEPLAMSIWFERMQDRWSAQTPASDDYIEQARRQQGALATFLGAQITGLDGPAPVWHAAALGDTVLFHVRDGRLLKHFPPLSAADFASNPDGISTRPGQLARMNGQLRFQQGYLAPGDILFCATDALAKWMIERDDDALWPVLASLSHPAVFARLVDEQRAAKALKDDDVTLLRLRLLTHSPSSVVVCL